MPAAKFPLSRKSKKDANTIPNFRIDRRGVVYIPVFSKTTGHWGYRNTGNKALVSDAKNAWGLRDPKSRAKIMKAAGLNVPEILPGEVQRAPKVEVPKLEVFEPKTNTEPEVIESTNSQSLESSDFSYEYETEASEPGQ